MWAALSVIVMQAAEVNYRRMIKHPKLLNYQIQIRGSIGTNVQKKQKLNVCSKDMVQNDSLLHHVEVHTAEMYVCDTCGNKFTKHILLENHIKTQHIVYQTTTPVFALHKPDHDSPSPERTAITPVQIDNSSEHVAVMEGTSSTPELIGSSVEHADVTPEKTSTRTIQEKQWKWKPAKSRSFISSLFGSLFPLNI